MNKFQRGLRQALTIARRDLTATVMTPTFLVFLLSPLLMIALSTLASLGATSAVSSGERDARIVVIATPARGETLSAIDKQMRVMFPGKSIPTLRIDTPESDVARQANATIQKDDDVAAVMFGPLESTHILRTATSYRESMYLAQLAEGTLRAERAGGPKQLSTSDIDVVKREQATSSGRGQVAYFAILALFALTLMLAGQAVGVMAEERSNKVIEVLAASVPLESVFFGKLVGALGTALLFIAFWGVLFANLPRFIPPNIAAGFAEMGAAVGPIFPLLFVIYFVMAYLLLSAVFLGIGALSSTQRELQMLSLPITMFQFAILGIASYGSSNPDSWLSIAAQVFPFSSPYAMVGTAAHSSALLPHLLAIGWQALWVAVVIVFNARLFRRGVLKSGSPKLRFKKPRTIDTTVS